jgi:hypothetical protein
MLDKQKTSGQGATNAEAGLTDTVAEIPCRLIAVYAIPLQTTKFFAEVFFMVLLILISIALLAAVSLFGKVRYVYLTALGFGLLMFLATIAGWFTP